MDNSLVYLRESLSNYTEKDELCERMFNKLDNSDYKTKEDFIRELTTREISLLDTIMKDEIEYAKQEQDEKRAKELNEVYELLF
ncbi:sporulation protein [Evansella sp. AB-rgal1]|uniref:sporulation protein n=1 Tax=Evansella sp. AB-rgal1 TaxID=3242696 RepID=UPI00359CD688